MDGKEGKGGKGGKGRSERDNQHRGIRASEGGSFARKNLTIGRSGKGRWKSYSKEGREGEIIEVERGRKKRGIRKERKTRGMKTKGRKNIAPV